eukprot:g180.t1
MIFDNNMRRNVTILGTNSMRLMEGVHDGKKIHVLKTQSAGRIFWEKKFTFMEQSSVAFQAGHQSLAILFKANFGGVGDSFLFPCLFLLVTVSAKYQRWFEDFTIEEAKNCTTVSGNLKIQLSALTNLSGLESLTRIDGFLEIFGNKALSSLSGLDNLSSVGGYLRITINDALTSLSGLESLTSVGGDLEISHSGGLTSLSGLESLTSVGGDLEIEDLWNLTSLSGLESLTSVGGWLRIRYNIKLTSLSGLENVTSAGGLRIKENNAHISVKAIDGLMSNTPCFGSYVETYEKEFLDVCVMAIPSFIATSSWALYVTGGVLLVALHVFVVVHRKRIPSIDPKQIFFAVLSLFDFGSYVLFALFLFSQRWMTAFAFSVTFLALSSSINFLISVFVLRQFHEVPEVAQWMRKHPFVTCGVAVVCTTNVDNLNLPHCGLFGLKAFSAPLGEKQLQMIAGSGLSTLIVEDLPQFAIQLTVLVTQVNVITSKTLGLLLPFFITVLSLGTNLAEGGRSLTRWHRKQNLPAAAVLTPFVAAASVLSVMSILFWAAAFHASFSFFLACFVILGINCGFTILWLFYRFIFACCWCCRHPLVVALAFIAGVANPAAGVKLLRCRFLGLAAFSCPETRGACCFRRCCKSHSCVFLEFSILAVYTLVITIVCMVDIISTAISEGTFPFLPWVLMIVNLVLLFVAVRTRIYLKKPFQQIPDTFTTEGVALGSATKQTLNTGHTNQQTPAASNDNLQLAAFPSVVLPSPSVYDPGCFPAVHSSAHQPYMTAYGGQQEQAGYGGQTERVVRAMEGPAGDPGIDIHSQPQRQDSLVLETDHSIEHLGTSKAPANKFGKRASSAPRLSGGSGMFSVLSSSVGALETQARAATGPRTNRVAPAASCFDPNPPAGLATASSCKRKYLSLQTSREAILPLMWSLKAMMQKQKAKALLQKGKRTLAALACAHERRIGLKRNGRNDSTKPPAQSVTKTLSHTRTEWMKWKNQDKTRKWMKWKKNQGLHH